MRSSVYILAALILFCAPAIAQEPTKKVVEWKSRKHVVGVTYEVWRNHSLGIRYLHVHESGSAGPSHGFLSWISYGLRPRVVLGGENGDAFGGDAAAALAMFGHTGGASVELAVGALRSGDDLVGVGSVGVMWSMLFFDVGYVLQLGTGKSDWLSPHQIGFRVNVPILEVGRSERTVRHD